VDQHLVFLLLGLANGAVYAAVALTLVVTYRSSGVVNFATGAMSLLGAYFYAFFRSGELLVPLPFFPESIDLGSNLDFWPAAILSVAICSAVGLLLYLCVFRPLRAAPPVAKAVASIGLMVVLTGVFLQKVGSTPVSVKPILPNGVWALGDIRISQDRVWMAVTIVLITLALAAAYRFTRFGLVTRAAAETEKGAFVSGISPDRVAAVNWMISAGVAAISGILIAPIVPATPLGYTLFIVPGLAAAVIGRFQYMVPAVAGGLAIGMIQSDVAYLRGQHRWLPSSGLAELVPLLLILLLFVAWARPLPSRGVLIRQTLGRAPRPRSTARPLIVGTAVGVVATVVLHNDWRAALIASMIFAIVSLSLVVVTGYAGQISLAQLTLAGVAGFLLGPLSADWQVPLIHTSIPFPIAPIVAALGAMVVGVVVGLPALRIRGLPVAIVTLALGVAIEAVWFHNTDYVSAGGKNIAGPELFGLDLRSRVGTDFPRIQFGLLVLAVLVVVAFFVARLRTSALGSEMLAVRANERSAAGAGIDVVRVKLVAFAIAAFIAGLGGTMLGYFQGNVTFDAFTTFVGLGLFASAYIGGITSVSGAIVAGTIAAGGLTANVAEHLPSLGPWYGVLSGLGLIFTVIKNPEGIVGPVHALMDRRHSRIANQRADRPAFDARFEPMEPVAGGEVVFTAHDIRVQYGGVVAVDGVDLEVRQGTIVGLIGPNGAGKTTLLDALSGFTPCKGEVALKGRAFSQLSPHRRARAGLGRTFQQAQLYDDLSVTENIVVGTGAARGRDPKALQEVLEILDLGGLADRPVGELSQGRRQLVSIARALIGNPDVLLLDEPAGGLDSRETQWLGHRLCAIRDSGVTIMLIDHDMHLVLNLCDAIYVLDFGKVIAQGPPATITADGAVTKAYLGSTHAAVGAPA
jgi:ABC-type branched-subunit amino acid transport system ATPase component/branched-subunit amino acid ABC-type transport system permease component